VRPWLTPKPDPNFEAKCIDVCSVYRGAIDAKQTVRTVSVDEMTGIQALEQIAPPLPMRPGKVERREFEYIRHGTQALIAALDVVTGKVIGSVTDTRTETDFAAFLETLFTTAPTLRWRIVCDNLDIHMSESIVRLVARQCGVDEASLGRKGRHGVLATKASRQAFLRDQSHRITFHFTPRHASWLNQIEIWFSILVRKLLRRASFASKADLKHRIEHFIDFFNRTMAKPFKWTWAGRPLAI
jgi:transposase